MQGRFRIGLALGTLVAIAMATTPVRAQDDVATIYQAAKKEGKVVYWGSPDNKTAQALSKRFAELYPGIAVELFKIQSAAAIERVITAANTGRHEVDVVDSVLGYVDLMQDRGLLLSYPWDKNLGVDPARILYNGQAVVVWDLDSPLAYNTNMVKPGELKTWDDPLDPKWRGKLIVEARAFMFAVLALKWGEQKAFDYLKKVMANKPIITKGGASTIEALAGGQGAIAYGAYGGILQRYADQGAPVAWAPIGPIPAAVAVLLPLKDAPHPNALKLWIKFITSPEAQKIIYKNMGLDLVRGKTMGPIGQRYKAAGLETVMESTDAPKMRALVAKAGSLVGALK